LNTVDHTTESWLKVPGAWYGWRLPSLAVALLGGLAALGAVLALRWLNLPWMIPATTVEHPLVTPLAFVFAGGFSYGLVKPFFLARGGHVTLSPAGVLAKRRGFTSRAVWNDLVAFTDDSSATLGLIRRGKNAPDTRLAVPTPTERERVAALRILDAHGLRRAEVAPRGRSLGRGLVTGLLASGAFLLGLHQVNARYWSLVELIARPVASAENAALLERSLRLDCVARPVAGTDDEVCLQCSLQAKLPSSFFAPSRYLEFELLYRVEDEGAVVGSRRLPCMAFGFGGSFPLPASYQETLSAPGHRLARGRHTLRVVAAVCLGEIRVEKTAEVSIEVLPGSIAERTVKLVAGAAPDLEIRIGPWTNGQLAASVFFEPHDRALAMDVAFLESGTELGRATFVSPKYESGGRWLAAFHSLRTGRHVLTFRFVPNAALGFGQQIGCTEILGEPIEKVVVFDAP
jgi:hypothetical protein